MNVQYSKHYHKVLTNVENKGGKDLCFHVIQDVVWTIETDGTTTKKYLAITALDSQSITVDVWKLVLKQ